ncbi:MAG: phosphatidylglycerol:prolipoprotein diacylglycerol transferase [Alphaproteobacteria bacterium]|jgi:phosphatidylglycerol:prolipoprotein diacylglycerol transferase
MPFPAIDPVAFSIFGWAVHWYGLAYVAAFLLGAKYIEYSFSKYGKGVNLNKDDADRIFTWVILGVILGGRVGYVFFYNPEYYMDHIGEAFKLWQGGMSFHGGLLGVLVACALYCKKYSINLLDLGDRLIPAFCIGLFLGRIANFINGELYGRVTDASYGIIFPHGGDLPRHASQLYEAALEGLLLFIILHFTLKARRKRGEVTGLFLIGYGTFRSMVEFVRERDVQLSDGIFETISMGQILSIPMILIGITLIIKSKKEVKG